MLMATGPVSRTMQRALDKVSAAGSFPVAELPKGVYTNTMLALYRRDLVRYGDGRWWPVEPAPGG